MVSKQAEHIQLIWEKFREGDKEAFAEIYNAFVDDLFRYGTKLCPDEGIVKDSIQEVFLDLFMTREKNNARPENIKFYLLLALKRNLIRKLKKNRKSEKRDSFESSLFEAQYSFEEELIRDESNKELWDKVNQAIAQLPPKQKEAVYLHFNQSMEYEKISRILDISIESVRKQVYRALKTVRESLEDKGLLLFTLLLKNRQ